MLIYNDDLKANAISAMENCMAYLALNDMTRAHRCYGEASAYETMLNDEGIILDEENEHYKEMMEIYFASTKKGALA